MNRYGRLAHDHWKTTDPARFAQIRNPQEFFSALGETVESHVQDPQAQLAGPDPAEAEKHMEKVGRLNTAGLQAEEAVLAEMVWLSPPEDQETLESANPGPEHRVRQAIWAAQNEARTSTRSLIPAGQPGRPRAVRPAGAGGGELRRPAPVGGSGPSPAAGHRRRAADHRAVVQLRSDPADLR